MVLPGNVIKLQDKVPGVTKLIPKPPPRGGSFFGTLLSVMGIAVSIAIPMLAPGGLAFTIGAEVVAAGVDLAFQSIVAAAEDRKLTATDYLFTIVGSSAAALSGIKAANMIKKSKRLTKEWSEHAMSKGYNKLQYDVITEQAERAIIHKAGARAINTELVRAGLTSDETIKALDNLSHMSKQYGINMSRFDNELSFIKQETQVFSALRQVTKKFGLDVDEMFQVLERSGIDIVGVQNTYQLSRAIKSNAKAAQELKAKHLFTKLEGALERDLEPTLFTRVLNAKNAESAITKVNKMLSLSNPNTFIGEVTNQIFDPIKANIEKKLLTPFKKRVRQKLKQIIRQDLVRKQETKNGVYPCFGSSWINWLRAVPLGNGAYKCLVGFRKWGYHSVAITPTLDLATIINWSESVSPGTIYHRFREQFGGPKGLFTNTGGDFTFQGNTAAVFNMLNFIPSKYISLGVSLISNITTARSVIAMDSWGNFFRNTDNLFRPLEDKALDLFGGQLAKAGRDQIMGNRKAMQNYFAGKVTEGLESRENIYRKTRKTGRGNLDSIKSLRNVIK